MERARQAPRLAVAAQEARVARGESRAQAREQLSAEVYFQSWRQQPLVEARAQMAVRFGRAARLLTRREPALRLLLVFRSWGTRVQLRRLLVPRLRT